MSVIHILSTELCIPGDRTRRVWLEPGRAIQVAPRAILTLLIDREDEGYSQPYARLQASEVDISLPLPAAFFNVSLLVLPRAMEIDGDGRPRRVLVEFQAPAQAWAV
ncbi:MAG: hypothetical protein ACOY5C_02905 [Pseudomonadota bacterium]